MSRIHFLNFFATLLAWKKKWFKNESKDVREIGHFSVNSKSSYNSTFNRDDSIFFQAYKDFF